MLLTFVAIARRDTKKGFRIKAFYSDENDGRDKENVVPRRLDPHQATIDILGSRTEPSYCVSWPVGEGKDGFMFYAKEFQGWAYIVITPASYPNTIAIECVDALSRASHLFQTRFMSKATRSRERSHFCRSVAKMYGDDEPGTILWELRTSETVDPNLQRAYAAAFDKLLQAQKDTAEAQRSLDEETERADKMRERLEDVEKVRAQVEKNILAIRDEIAEKTGRLVTLAAECEDRCKLFRRNASLLRQRTARAQTRSRFILGGTALCAVGGGAAMFMAGGPTAPALLVFLSNQSAAQAIETVAATGVSAIAGYFISCRVESTMFWAQIYIGIGKKKY